MTSPAGGAGRRSVTPMTYVIVAVILFGILSLLIVLAVNGSGIPAAGTPIIDAAATDRIGTENAQMALTPTGEAAAPEDAATPTPEAG